MDNQNTTYNLDDQTSEFFTFRLKGHNYQFRYMTLDELDGFKVIQDSEEKAKEYLFQFITPMDEKSPQIQESFTKMTIPEVKNFFNMLKTELSTV